MTTERHNLALTAILASVLVLSVAAFLPLRAASAAGEMDNNHDDDTMTSSTDETKVLEAEASNALYEPAAGLSNVFGPDGLFPMPDTFDCADALTCGVAVDGEFKGTFEEGNENDMTGYTATFTAPITYGPQQIEGHTYEIELTDTMWNASDIPEPTRVAEFTQMVNNVGFHQMQHGASYVDRSDVPQLYDYAFLYGHVKFTDVTNGNDTVVAEDVFTHVMVAHVVDENDFYRNLKETALSPTMVFLFAINIPPGEDLPGEVGELTPEQAQSFTPLSTDPSLENSPQVDYPVSIPEPRSGEIDEPESQSTIWPVGNPEQPLLFNFLIYQDAEFSWENMDVEDDDSENGMTATAGDGSDTSIDLVADEDSNVIVVRGAGFEPNAQITMSIDGDTETTTVTQADSAGAFVSLLQIPSGSEGESLTITAESDAGATAEETVDIE